MVGEPDGATTSRVRQIQHVLAGAGFPTLLSADIGGWLVGHAAFVVPIALALSGSASTHPGWPPTQPPCG